MADAQPSWPDGVSVIMPVLNEQRHLSEAVTGILTQDWDGPLEIILALGPSTDRTDEVARRLQALDDRVVLVPNPSGRTPSGLNAAIRAARYEVVVRVDGHALLPTDYLSTAVATLARTAIWTSLSTCCQARATNCGVSLGSPRNSASCWTSTLMSWRHPCCETRSRPAHS